MTETKFTPGPWAIEYQRDFRSAGNTLVVLNPERYPTAMVPAWDAPKEGEVYAADEAKANARLIAAAPEMFEALRAVEGSGVLIGPREEAVGEEAMSLVRLALSKALGNEGV